MGKDHGLCKMGHHNRRFGVGTGSPYFWIMTNYESIYDVPQFVKSRNLLEKNLFFLFIIVVHDKCSFF